VLNQLSKVAPEIAADIPDLRRVVAFRNILVHGYATVEDTCRAASRRRSPVLEKVLRSLLERA